MEWLVAYALGFLTIPFVLALGSFFGWAFTKNRGWGPCDHCKRQISYEPGDKFNITDWIIRKRHQYILARTKRHRKARGDDWREKVARGSSVYAGPWNSTYML